MNHSTPTHPTMSSYVSYVCVNSIDFLNQTITFDWCEVK